LKGARLQSRAAKFRKISPASAAAGRCPSFPQVFSPEVLQSWVFSKLLEKSIGLHPRLIGFEMGNWRNFQSLFP
jgi:hypothetical protein